VITSNFGSMREIGEAGGAMLIDPRRVSELRDAMRALITDDDLHRRLSAEAAAVPERTWETYAAETWSYLVEDKLLP
jgi:glycosyltransferase involved in cell wall biosynthesis